MPLHLLREWKRKKGKLDNELAEKVEAQPRREEEGKERKTGKKKGTADGGRQAQPQNGQSEKNSSL